MNPKTNPFACALYAVLWVLVLWLLSACDGFGDYVYVGQAPSVSDGLTPVAISPYTVSSWGVGKTPASVTVETVALSQFGYNGSCTVYYFTSGSDYPADQTGLIDWGAFASGKNFYVFQQTNSPAPVYTWAASVQNSSAYSYQFSCYVRRGDGGEWFPYSGGDFSVSSGGSYTGDFSLESDTVLSSVGYFVSVSGVNVPSSSSWSERLFSSRYAGTFSFNFSGGSIEPPSLPPASSNAPPADPTSDPLPDRWPDPPSPDSSNPSVNVNIDPNDIAQGVSAGLNQSGIRSDVQDLANHIAGGSAALLPSLESDGLSDIDWNAPDGSGLSDNLSDGIGENRGGFVSSWLGGFFSLSLPSSVGKDGVFVISISDGPISGLPSEVRCDLTQYPIVSGLRAFLVVCNAVMTVIAAVFIYKGTF